MEALQSLVSPNDVPQIVGGTMDYNHDLWMATYLVCCGFPRSAERPAVRLARVGHVA